MFSCKNLKATPFPFADANGNCVTYVDNAGNTQTHYTYDAFGGIVSSDGDMDDDFRFRFSSKYLDDETGLYYYGFRFYSPSLGRWVSRDRIDELGGLLLYGFVENNPVGFFDKLGDVTWTPEEWVWFDFLAWYFIGMGGTIDLSDWTQLDDFKQEIQVTTDTMKGRILDTLEYLECAEDGTSSATLTGSDTEVFRVASQASSWRKATSSMGILNNGQLAMDYDCQISLTCGCCNGDDSPVLKEVDMSCKLTFSMSDRFANPHDWWGDTLGFDYERDTKGYDACVSRCFDKYGYGFLHPTREKCLADCRKDYPISDYAFPYSITASWNEDYSYHKEYECE